MTYLIKNPLIIDPSAGLSQRGDLLLCDGAIAAVGGSYDPNDYPGAQVIEAGGLCAAPGLVDMHVHLRDPGQTHKENILTGCEAAAAGGFTAVACMPNTTPPCDSPKVVDYILQKAGKAKARVFPVAAISQGLRGEALTDFAALKAAGAVAVSDDGRPVENPELMRKALCEAAGVGLLVTSHCEDLQIAAGGIMHKGSVSAHLGVPGIDRVSEDRSTARELRLAEETGMPLHICHVSTAGSVELIRRAKARGVRVTCETAPHYLMFTHQSLLGRDANFRMNPPLREEEDLQALLAGIADGTIDAIATDHAPHTPEEKADFDRAPNGVIGLETALAACITALVEPGIITLPRLIELMSATPARLLGVEGGSLAVGSRADVVLFDPKGQWVVEPAVFRSRSRNTPFAGKRLTSRVRYTFLAGQLVFEDEKRPVHTGCLYKTLKES